MTRVKVGTVLDENLYQRVQEAAQAEGRSISQLLEEALELYLSHRQFDGASLIRETFGKYSVKEKDLRLILEDDPYDAR